MAKNFNVVMPYEPRVPLGKVLITANANYDGSTGAYVDLTAPSDKQMRLHHLHFQSRGTNPATLIRLYIVDAVGAISPLRPDVKAPATTASSTQPLWSKRWYARGIVIPAGSYLRGQTVANLTAGIAVTPHMQVMET